MKLLLRSASAILLAASSVAMTGCATPQEAAAMAAGKTSYQLCENLALAVLASDVLRNSWAVELQRRGENCSQYMATIESVRLGRDATMQQANTLLQQRPAPTQPRTITHGTAFFKRSYKSGLNTICVYDRLGSEEVITVSAVDLCPVTR